jgi:hypothetical protein
MTGIEKQRIESGDLWTDDFAVGCQYPRSMMGGEPCQSNAAYWVERHVPNFCRHPSLEDGCATGFVCGEHLIVLEAEALRIIRRNNPPRWMFWRRETGWCRSCGTRKLQITTDILQTVIVLRSEQ